MIYILLTGLLTIVLAAHNQYRVHPDDTPCLQPPCHTLEYFTNNSDVYFVSDTTLFFGQGEYYHLQNHLIIQNLSNFSLIGTPNTNDPTSPVSVIRCLPDHSIYFYNVTTLLIKHIKLEGCGCLISKILPRVMYIYTSQNYWAAMYFHCCTDVSITNTYIYYPVRYGIFAFNMMGRNNFENVTILMGKQAKQSWCSYGLYFHYDEDEYGSTVEQDEKGFINISNIALIGNCKSDCSCRSGTTALDMVIRSFNVFVTIKHSNFSNWNIDYNIYFDITSSSDVIISFFGCNFVSNNITSNLIDIWYNIPCISDPANYPKHVVIFNESLISHTNYYNEYNSTSDVSLLSITISSDCLDFALHVNNVMFYKNKHTLLKVKTDLEMPCLSHYHLSYLISTTGYFIAEDNRAQTLLSLQCGQIHFNGITRFINNRFMFMSEAIYLSSTMLKFSNSILFDNNHCKQLISLDCKQCYSVLSGIANLTLLHNTVSNQLIRVPTRYNNPYPYCLFQYYSPVNNQFNSFQTNLYFNRWYNNRIYHSISKLASHCKWAPGAAFKNNISSIGNKEIVTLKVTNNLLFFHLGDHTTVCYCPPSSHYNCSVNQLGPVYPGENLTVNLCLPYNDGIVSIMYVETYNDNLSESACKIYEHNSMRHVFY